MHAFRFPAPLRHSSLPGFASLLLILSVMASWAGGALAAEPANDGQPPKLTTSGKVLDPAGKPVAGAKVLLREWSSYRRSEAPFAPEEDLLASTTTDAQGKFSFQDVATRPFQKNWPEPAPWDVLVEAEGYALAWQHLMAPNPPAPLSLTLQPAAQLSGKVVDAQGKPVADARVRVEEIAPLGSPLQSEYLPPNRLDLAMSPLAPAQKTDAQGEFRLTGLPPSMRLTLSVEHDDFVRQSVFVATTEEAQPDLTSTSIVDGKPQSVSYSVASGKVEVQIQPGCRLTGQISYADSKQPCVQAQVAMTSPAWHPAVTDDQGRFTITGVAPGQCQLMAYPPQDAVYLVRQLTFTIAPEERQKSLAIALEPGQLVRGRIVAVDTRAGVAGVEVYYQTETPPQGAERSLARAGMSDAQGAFRVIAPAGEAELILSGPVEDYYVPAWRFHEAPDPRFVQPIKVVAGKPLENLLFTVTRGLIVAGVVNDPQGQPVAGAEVMAVRTELDNAGPSPSTQTDEMGHFALTGLPPADPQELLVLQPDRKWIASVEIEAAKEDLPTRTVPVKVQLQPAARVSGQVLLEKKPLAGVPVTLLIFRMEKEQRYAVASDTASTDAQGQYQFDMLEPGEEYAVACHAVGYSQEETETFRPKAAEAAELTPLEPLRTDHSVAGVVVDPAGKPLEGVVVGAQTRAGRRIGGAVTQQPTGKDGRFTIEAVPNQPLTLVAYLPPTDGIGPKSSIPTAQADATPDQTDARIVLDPTKPAASEPEKDKEKAK